VRGVYGKVPEVSLVERVGVVCLLSSKKSDSRGRSSPQRAIRSVGYPHEHEQMGNDGTPCLSCFWPSSAISLYDERVVLFVVQIHLLVDSPSPSCRRTLRHPSLRWDQRVPALHRGLRNRSASPLTHFWRQTEKIEQGDSIVNRSRLLNAMGSPS